MVSVDLLVTALCLYPLALLPYLMMRSKYQREAYQNQSRLKALKNRQAEISELKSQLRQATSRLIDSDYRLWEFQQDLKEQSETREHLLESMFLELKKTTLTFPEKPEFESQSWQSGYPQVPHPDTTEAMGR